MALEVDKYDPATDAQEIGFALMNILGSVGIRAVGPEVDWFIAKELPYFLKKVFSKAEGVYVNRMVDQATQSSENLIKGVLAGVELQKRSKK